MDVVTMKSSKASHLTLPATATGPIDVDEDPREQRGSGIERPFARQMLGVLGNPPIAPRLWNGEGGGPGIDRGSARQMLDVLGNPPIALRLWNGEEVAPAGVTPTMRAHLRD